ncbi:hypothetical protein [Lacipirellula parvula]|uniref:hypothetical protein n=1 Tax=Lacipirellula parvula TaxID=2650471 RepID=UPI0012609C61|nr:hypothetical protein [Lacipirellula parvula]
MALVSSGFLLPLVMAGAAIDLYKGDAFGEVVKTVGTVVAGLALIFSFACAAFVVFGIAAAEYARRFVRGRP